MTKHGKKYVEAEKQIPAEPVSPLAAMKLLKEISVANFDETVTGDFRLGIDTRQADQQLRGTVSLPNGSGKTVRVAVFAEGAAAQAAEEAGADIVGTDELMQQIQAGEFNFDAAVATPDQMGKVGRLGKILGPRGLMPNPKLGTVTNDVAKAIKELKGGRVEYRADRYGIAHVVLGKVSFTPEQLAEICARFGAIAAELRDKGISVKIDDRDNVRPGFKFAEYELKGVPVRLAMGGRDLENGTIELVRRDTLEKQTISQEGLVERIEGLMAEIQENIYKKALAYRESMITKVDTWEEFKRVLDEKGGFLSAHWDGTVETEVAIKEATKATIRCIPVDAVDEEGVCVFSGRPSHRRVLFARSY